MTIELFLIIALTVVFFIDTYIVDKQIKSIEKYIETESEVIVTLIDKINIIEDWARVMSGEMTEEEYQKKWGIENVKSEDNNIS